MQTGLLWIRHDLRLADNEALRAVASQSDRLLIVYIDDPDQQVDTAHRWWLQNSLQAFAQSLQQLQQQLVVHEGKAISLLPRLIRHYQIQKIYWNRSYTPEQQAIDTQISASLQQAGTEIESFNNGLLHEPGEILKADGSPYRVFTPFWRCCLRGFTRQNALAAPDKLPKAPAEIDGHSPFNGQLLQAQPWHQGLAQHWSIGELAAKKQIQQFKNTSIAEYQQLRDVPAELGTSRLSPHLHFGECTARQIATQLEKPNNKTEYNNVFLRQLYWREFAHHLLHYFPESVEQPLNAKFKHFPWRTNYQSDLQAWQQGRTGIPLIDAGMRELWHTGWMHNRVRMIVASFLCKNLLIPWQQGAAWFMHTLVDADLANNTMGWQWVAGCGVDAAPYFRIFNPLTQSKKFDPRGEYLRRWLKPLRLLNDKKIHAPWLASDTDLKQAGVTLGSNYPLPIVSLDTSRKLALSAYNKSVRGQQ